MSGMAVLFLCESNGGPSPLAEAITRALRPGAEVWSAGATPSHVRAEVRTVLMERGFPRDGLRAKGLAAVPVEDVSLIVRLSRGLDGLRLPKDVRCIDWLLPDPASYPDDERLDAYRATRDELERRISALPAEVFA